MSQKSGDYYITVGLDSRITKRFAHDRTQVFQFQGQMMIGLHYCFDTVQGKIQLSEK